MNLTGIYKLCLESFKLDLAFQYSNLQVNILVYNALTVARSRVLSVILLKDVRVRRVERGSCGARTIVCREQRKSNL